MLKLNILIFALLIFSITSSDNYEIPFSLYNNTIEINSYKSKISNDELINYQDWISIRNAFYYSNTKKIFSKYEVFFDVSNPDYLKNMNNFGIPFFFFSIFLFVFLFFYLIMRFIVGKCLGPKKIVKSYIIQSRIILIIGLVLSFIFIIIQLFFIIKSNSSINDIISYAEKQKNEMNELYSQTLNNMTDIINSKIETGNGTLNYKKEIYMNESITQDIKIISDKITNFQNDVSKAQKGKFIFQIIYFVLLILFTSLAIGGYFIRRHYLLWISSFFLFLLTPFLVYFLGKEMILSFVGIEFCQNIGNSITSEIIPSGNKNLGYYISCSSKDTQKKIHTAIYEINESFNIIYNFVLLNIKNNSYNESDLNMLINKKREKETFENIKKKYSEIQGIKDSCDILIKLNYVLAGLLSLTDCRTPKNIINYSEDHFCARTINNMIYNIFFGILVSISVIILSIGINKHMTVLRYVMDNSLRGKKQFNDDILEEEKEEEDNGIIN